VQTSFGCGKSISVHINVIFIGIFLPQSEIKTLKNEMLLEGFRIFNHR
jgi:hypothetical protein